MPQIRLTKGAIERIPFTTERQVLYRDASLPGFGLRVGQRAKSFFVEAQVAHRTVRATIGRYGHITPERARQIALKLLGEMAEDRDPNAGKRAPAEEPVTVERAYDAFFAAKPHLAPRTVRDYRRGMELHLEDWSGRPIGEVTRQMVLKRHRLIAETAGAVMANNVFRHFRSVYNFTAATHDDLPANPVDILKQARAWSPERRRRTVIPISKLPDWCRAVMAAPDYARDFLLIALFTGMRRGEICRLRWDHVDLVDRCLHLPRTKNGDPLDLPLSDFLVDLISARRELVGQSEWVFPGRGCNGHLTEPKKFVACVSRQSGVAFTLHDLRRTFITIAESLDIPAYALKRLLNHRTDTDVTGGYIVIDVERLRVPVQRVADRILELVDE